VGTKFTLILDVDPGDHEFDLYVQWEGTSKKILAKYSHYLLERLARRLFNADDGGVLDDNEVQGCTAVEVKLIPSIGMNIHGTIGYTLNGMDTMIYIPHV
jgi:hypothetical protein